MKALGLSLVLLLCTLGGCISQHAVHVDPIQLRPIQVTMDVNVRVQEGPREAAAPTAGGADDARTDAEDS